MTDPIFLKAADFNSLQKDSTISIVGKRRAGKTTVGRYIAQFIKSGVTRFIAMCGTRESQTEWCMNLPQLFVVDKSVAALQKIIRYQDSKVVKCGVDGKYDGGESVGGVPDKYRVCLIIDDCGCDKKFMNSPEIREIFANGRHYGISTVIMLQYFNQLTSDNRSNLDYLGVLNTNNLVGIKKIWQEFGGGLSFIQFQRVVTKTTKKQGHMCWINNTASVSATLDTTTGKLYPSGISFARITHVDPILSQPLLSDAIVRRACSLETLSKTEDPRTPISMINNCNVGGGNDERARGGLLDDCKHRFDEDSGNEIYA